MPANLDFVADKNHATFVKIASVVELPDYVKKADKSALRPAFVPPRAYADLKNKQFPCHSKVATWVSAAYFFDKKAAYEPTESTAIEQRLLGLANYWGIAPDVRNLRTKLASAVTAERKDNDEALPDDVFAFVKRNADGTKTRRLRLRNAVEVKAAADWLNKYCDDIPYEDRNTIACNIIDKAVKYGAAISEHRTFLEKQAGYGLCDPKEVTKLLRDRAKQSKTANDREQMLAVANAVETTPVIALQQAQLVKLATIVDQFDRGNGLTQQYANGLARPEDVVFSVTFTKAAEEVVGKHVETTSGCIYEKSAFGRLPLSDLEAAFGEEFKERVRTGLAVDCEKLAEEVSALPRPDAEMFDALCRDQSITPITQKSAAVQKEVRDEVMQAWAEMYN